MAGDHGHQQQPPPALGILRAGPLAPRDIDASVGGNVAFLDPPPLDKDKTDSAHAHAHLHAYPRASRAVTPTSPDSNDHSPLVFTKRPTLNSGRSSFSCSTCGRSAPISPVSGDDAAGASGTPPLTRSDTDVSEVGDAGAGGRAWQRHHRSCHHAPFDSSSSSSPPGSLAQHQQVSLLTAALLADDSASSSASSSTRRQQQHFGAGQCGILKRDSPSEHTLAPPAQPLPDNSNHPDGDAVRATARSRGPRFVEPPKPVRPTPRRVSLPPQRRLSNRSSSPAVPGHYSEGPPPSPPAMTPAVVFERNAAADVGNAAPTAPTAPPRRSALTFQDADEVKSRSNDPRRQPHSHLKQEAGTSSALAGPSDRAAQSSTIRLHPQDPSLLARRDQTSSPAPTPPPRLKFAASPSELKVSRRPSQRLRYQQRREQRRTPSTSDEEGPYVDSVAAASLLSASTTAAAATAATAATTRPPMSSRPPRPPPLRSGSPAPRKLGGSEVGGRGSGQGRPRSPAPRGKILIPHNDRSDEEGDEDVVDDLDYDEDDEGSEDDDEDDDDDEEDDDDDDDDEDEDGQASENNDDSNRKDRHAASSSSSPPLANFASRSAKASPPPSSLAPRRAASPNPSLDSQSHPAAFSNSDFEEESEFAERQLDDDREGGDDSNEDSALINGDYHSPVSSDAMSVAAGAGARSRSRGTPTFSSLSNSPLPFARQRVPPPTMPNASFALSDGEACTSTASGYSRRASSHGGARVSASPRGHGGYGGETRLSRAQDWRWPSRPPPSPARSRSSGVLLTTRGTCRLSSPPPTGPTSTAPGLAPASAAHSHAQAQAHAPPFAPRSLSSSAVAAASRCAPSLGASHDYAQAQGGGALNATSDNVVGVGGRSPDAFMALRHCLESAFADDVGDAGAASQRAPHRKPWFTAFSTPGVLSPTHRNVGLDWSGDGGRGSEAEPDEEQMGGEEGGAHDASRSRAVGAARVAGLAPPARITGKGD